jgi:Co/Zn/Cd efflux system component
MYSEHIKSKHGHLDVNTKFILEVGIPSFSVCALLGVTVWITLDAIAVIRNPENDSVNVYFLFGFAGTFSLAFIECASNIITGANFLVDMICAALFYMRKDDLLKQRRMSFLKQPLNEDLSAPPKKTHGMNLNMASALTHVGGDTLRTTAVFVAAVVSSTTNVNSALCDAWAAIVVTATIIFLVIPLVREIYGIARVHPFWNKSEEQERNSSFAQSVAREISSQTSQSQPLLEDIATA